MPNTPNPMNLYDIQQVNAVAEIDQEIRTICLLLAQDDEAVYEWIKSNPELKGQKRTDALSNDWAVNEEDDVDIIFPLMLGCDMYSLCYKEKIVKMKGEASAYTWFISEGMEEHNLIGWKLIKEKFEEDYSILKEYGILYVAD